MQLYNDCANRKENVFDFGFGSAQEDLDCYLTKVTVIARKCFYNGNKR